MEESSKKLKMTEGVQHVCEWPQEHDLGRVVRHSDMGGLRK